MLFILLLVVRRLVDLRDSVSETTHHWARAVTPQYMPPRTPCCFSRCQHSYAVVRLIALAEQTVVTPALYNATRTCQRARGVDEYADRWVEGGRYTASRSSR